MMKIDKSAIVFWVSLIGGVASILGLMISLASPGDWQTKHIAVSSAAYILFLIGIELYILIERGRLVRKHDSALREATSERDSALREVERVRAYRANYEPLHAISHAFRDSFSVRFGQDVKKVEFETQDSEFCLKVLEIVSVVFSRLTGTTCATCIKAYIPSHEVMVTIGRDNVSKAERYEVLVTRVQDNTAWMHIVRDQQTHFFSNNLRLLAAANAYKNDRSDWGKFYMSTIVWPIRKVGTQASPFHLFGVLCVDSKVPDAFDEKGCFPVGSAVVDMIYPYLSRIDPESIWKNFDPNLGRGEQGSLPKAGAA